MRLTQLGRVSVGARLAALACALVAVCFTVFAWTLAHSPASSWQKKHTCGSSTRNSRSARWSTCSTRRCRPKRTARCRCSRASCRPISRSTRRVPPIGGVAAPTPRGRPAARPRLFDSRPVPEESGAIATIFARDGDDFVRITTSLKAGRRACRRDETRPCRPRVRTARRRTQLHGLAKLFGRPYITQYKPVTDATGRVIGALFVGSTSAPNSSSSRTASAR